LDQPTFLTAVVLGIVEGLTEFLPVSSTGHLIVTGSLLGYTGEQAKTFEIVIQAGAILAVCWEFRARLTRVLRGLFSDRAAQRFAANLVIAFLPAAVLGLAFGKAIKAHLFAPVPVACAFIAGRSSSYGPSGGKSRGPKPCASHRSTTCAGPMR
jgi:undecaprenyl-diphosphatase